MSSERGFYSIAARSCFTMLSSDSRYYQQFLSSGLKNLAGLVVYNERQRFKVDPVTRSQCEDLRVIVIWSVLLAFEEV